MVMKIIGKVSQYPPKSTRNQQNSSPKRDSETHQKYVIKFTLEITIWGSKLGVFFCVFCFQNRPRNSLEINWGPKPRKHQEITLKITQKYEKTTPGQAESMKHLRFSNKPRVKNNQDT